MPDSCSGPESFSSRSTTNVSGTSGHACGFVDDSCATPPIDYSGISALFRQAEAEGRDFLFEYETYDLLARSGAETPPRTHLLLKNTRVTDEVLGSFPGPKVVLKIVSPTIIHKTEVGGVRVVENNPSKIRSAWRRMLYEVPENYALMIERNRAHAPEAYRTLEGEALRNAISADVRGVLMVQFMPPDSEAFGNEMIVGIRNTREFGMVISAGLGGTDTELYAERFRKGQAIVAASTAMTTGEQFFELYRKTISYRKLAGLTRGQKRIVTDEQLIECFASFIAMANHYSPENPETSFVIEELEINPFAFTEYLMVPLDGMCRFGKPAVLPNPRPVERIGNLLKPHSIGIIGVSSTRVNFGRTIMDNVVASGFPKERMRLIKPDMDSFEGIPCVPDLASLDIPLDLFVVAVGAAQVPDLVDEVIDTGCARSVMLIPGGMGETEESRERAEQVIAKINAAHAVADGGPVFLGANSMGVISHPGQYDTWFVPEEKLPKARTAAVAPVESALLLNGEGRTAKAGNAELASKAVQPDGGVQTDEATKAGETVTTGGPVKTDVAPKTGEPVDDGKTAKHHNSTSTRNAAFVSQSGAFMLTRVSKSPHLDPAYLCSIGNQTDLTLSDMVNYLKNEDDIDVIAVYAEGFNDLDGLHFTRAVRDAVLAGKDVVFYKAGRTPEGKTATSGHTASLAGDYMVCESCITQAGGMVARSFTMFEELFMLACKLHDKQITGNRLAAVSGAGFEAVGMADSIQSDDYSLAMAQFSPETVERIAALMQSKKLGSLVTVHNPLDINPASDDEAHVETVRYLLEDPRVDAVVVGLDPMSPAMRTLENTPVERFSYNSPESIAVIMPQLNDAAVKPVIGVVDGGRLYDPLVDTLMNAGLPVFRSSDRAVATLAMYIEGRLRADRIRSGRC